MTTQNTLTIAGTTTVTTTVGEFVAFTMDKANGITVPFIETQLVSLGASFKKKDTKEVKAKLWFEALEAQASAIGETLVAETTTEEEVNMNTKHIEVRKSLHQQTMEKNMKALLASPISKKDNLSFMMGNHSAYENFALVDMLAKVTAAKDRYVAKVGEHKVILEEVEFYAEKAVATRDQIRNKKVIREYAWKNKEGFIRIIGEVIVRMPKGYAQIKQWNKNKVNSKGKLGAPEFVKFEDMDINLSTSRFDSRKRLADGSGLVSLSITEMKMNDGTVLPLSVQLPYETWNDGSKHQIFRTSDARYAKTKDVKFENEPLYLEDNNGHFNAQVTALVRVYANEFVQALAANRHGHNDVYCTNMVKFKTKDGVMDDVDAESKKTLTIIEQPDVMQLAQVGSEQPSAYCMVRNIWLDAEGVETLNIAEQHERATYQDEDGNFQYQRHDEIMIAGKAVKRNTVKEMSIRKNCEACPFYCGNTPKSESQVSREKVAANEKGGGYVSNFFRGTPKPERQAVETLVEVNGKENWALGFPGEFLGKVDDIKKIRVKSAGVSVYASNNVISNMDPEFIAPVEAYDARHAEVTKLINQIFFAAFNYETLSAEQIDIITDIVDNKPEGMTFYEAEKWDKAVFWFTEAIGWELEAQARRQQELFPTHFFPGVVTSKKIVFEGTVKGKRPFLRIPVLAGSMTEIHVEDIMGDTLYRAEQGSLGWGLGYEDLSTDEFVRYLDESAIDYVYDVILDGKEFCIVGGSDKDKELASGALQVMLQQELNWIFIKGVRRDAEPLEALLKLKVSDDVKYYIAGVVGLTN